MKKSTSGEGLNKRSNESKLKKSSSKEKINHQQQQQQQNSSSKQGNSKRGIRRTKSLGELDEHSRLSKLVKSFQNRFGSLKRNVDNSLGGYPSILSFQVVAVALVPFLPLYIYALVVFFSSITLFFYLIFLIFYFCILLAWAVTEIAIRPPWYQPSTPEQGLPTNNAPAYWQGVIHDPKYDLGLNYKDIEFKNSSGLTIRGWYVSCPNSHTAVVLVHGGGTDRRAWLRHVPLFHSEGVNCLLFDCSQHGLSDGTRLGFSFGVREHEDVRAAVSYLKNEYKMKTVIACGTSVGGASAILAGALDSTIDGVIAENPVARVDQFATFHLERLISPYTSPWFHHLFMKPFYLLVMKLFLFRIGENPFNVTYVPCNVVDRISPRPLLLMHGDDDNIVPCDHSYRLFEAAREPKTLWIARDANHCALYDKYPDQYYKYIHEFLTTHFSIQRSAISSPSLHSLMNDDNNDHSTTTSSIKNTITPSPSPHVAGNSIPMSTVSSPNVTVGNSNTPKSRRKKNN